MRNTIRTVDQAFQFLKETLPDIDYHGEIFESVSVGAVTMRLPHNMDHYKNGIFSGPLTMGLCDTAMYVTAYTLEDTEGTAVMANFNMEFLKLIPKADLLIKASVIERKGRSILIGAELMEAAGENIYGKCSSRYVLIEPS